MKNRGIVSYKTIALQLLTAMVLSCSVGLAYADQIILSNSDAAHVMADRYAKKHNISFEQARQDLIEAGVFTKPAGSATRTASAPTAPPPVQARPQSTSVAIAPSTSTVTARPPVTTTVASAKSAAPTVAVASQADGSTKTAVSSVVNQAPVVALAQTPALATKEASLANGAVTAVAGNASIFDTQTVALSAPVAAPVFTVSTLVQPAADWLSETKPWMWFAFGVVSSMLLFGLKRLFKSPKTPMDYSALQAVPVDGELPEAHAAEPARVDNVSYYLPVEHESKSEPQFELPSTGLQFDFSKSLSMLKKRTLEQEPDVAARSTPTKSSTYSFNGLTRLQVAKTQIQTDVEPEVSEDLLVRSTVHLDKNEAFATSLKTPSGKLRELLKKTAQI